MNIQEVLHHKYNWWSIIYQIKRERSLTHYSIPLKYSNNNSFYISEIRLLALALGFKSNLFSNDQSFCSVILAYILVLGCTYNTCLLYSRFSLDDFHKSGVFQMKASLMTIKSKANAYLLWITCQSTGIYSRQVFYIGQL